MRENPQMKMGWDGKSYTSKRVPRCSGCLRIGSIFAGSGSTLATHSRIPKTLKACQESEHYCAFTNHRSS